MYIITLPGDSEACAEAMNRNVGCWGCVVAVVPVVAVGYDEVSGGCGGVGEDAECSGEDFTLETVT
jgi:hypothetical protein